MTTATVPADTSLPGGASPWAGRLALGLLTLLLGLWTARLFPEWLDNPDLSHGLFTPLLFVFLLHEARTRGTRRWMAPAVSRWAAPVCLALGLILLLSASLYAVAVDWSHALVEFTIGGALVLALLAALLVASNRDHRLLPLNWPALVAVALWALSLPLPPGTYSRLTLQLQLGVTEAVVHSLHLLGIPASKSGNVIDLARTTVGVEEACSGVRSLLSCLYAGLVFSALLVNGRAARVLLVVLAIVLALGMNFLRSLLLTLLAYRGIDITGTWHDATGFAILGLTAALLGGLAVLLPRAPAAHRPGAADVRPGLRLHRGDASLLTGACLAALLIAGAFGHATRPAASTGRQPPNLEALLPAHGAGWDHVATADLESVTGVLQTRHLVQRSFLRQDASGLTQITIYLAYWSPGQAPVSVVASHTPDMCWPGAGWELQRDSRVQRALTFSEPARALSPAEYRLFVNERLPQHVWFWHVYDNRVISSPDSHSPLALMRAVWRFGVRSQGDQLFVRVSSNRPWAEIEQEKLVRDLFAQLTSFGL